MTGGAGWRAGAERRGSFGAVGQGYGCGMADELVVLRGGSRDGESTTVQEGVRRLLAAGESPGLLDVYEANGQTEQIERNSEPALVFVHAGQRSADGVAPELLHHPYGS